MTNAPIPSLDPAAHLSPRPLILLYFFCRFLVAFPGIAGLRFQKRFPFRREKITRDLCRLRTPTETISIVCTQAGGYAGILDATCSAEGAVGWLRAAYLSSIKRKLFGSMGFVK
jgi:hypothetical protein